MKDKITGYDAYWIGFDKYKDKCSDNFITIPEWKLYLLHSTNNYAYFRLFSIRYVGEIGDTNNAIYQEVKELKSVNQKKLKYSLRKDKTNWLGEIPCFKTSCIKHNDNEGNYTIVLPFILCCGSNHTPITPTLKQYNFSLKDNTIYLGNTDMDTLEKQILEQKQKLEPPKEEPKEEPKELSELNKNHEEEMNVFLKQLHYASEMFKGAERDSIIQGLCNIQVEKNLLKLKSIELNKLKEEVKEKMGDSEFFNYMP